MLIARDSIIRRLFVIEPGLVGVSGHPIQYALALQKYCESIGIEVVVVCRNNADAHVYELINNLVPILQYHCFPVCQEAAVSFAQALHIIDGRYLLNMRDLLLLSSAYVNELKGLGEFLSECDLRVCAPFVAVNFHQFLPPAQEAANIRENEFRSRYIYELKNAFANPAIRDRSAVGFWTTESDELNKEYSEVSGLQIGRLPFLFEQNPRGADRQMQTAVETARIGFMGDGRAEKGLLILLRAIREWFPPQSNVDFVIQNIFPRGWSTDQEKEIRDLLDDLRHWTNVTLIEHPLDPYQFSTALTSVTALVFPYAPSHYYNRASLLFIQGVAEERIAIVSSKTWLAEQVLAGAGCGVVFEYIEGDVKATSESLAGGIWDFLARRSRLSEQIRAVADFCREHHSAQHYLATIIAQYPNSQAYPHRY